MKLAIALSGLIFPGLGHALLGKRKRALVFFVVLSGMYFAGVFLEREFYFKFGDGIIASAPKDVSVLHDRRGDELEGNVDKIWKVIFVYGYPGFVGIGNYLIGWKWTAATAGYVKYIPGVLKADEIPVTTRDIGYCFALLAGLLNLLVMMDAYDIACNMEELEKRAKNKKEKEVAA